MTRNWKHPPGTSVDCWSQIRKPCRPPYLVKSHQEYSSLCETEHLRLGTHVVTRQREIRRYQPLLTSRWGPLWRPSQLFTMQTQIKAYRRKRLCGKAA